MGASPIAAAMLIAAMLSMLIYNLHGKRFRLPLLSDAAQALGWVALTMYGALATGARVNEIAMWLAATIFVYNMLINGLHGGLRDIANDQRHGARTTALWFGAHADADGHLLIPRAQTSYGLALHVLLLVFQVVCFARNWPSSRAVLLITISSRRT